MTVTFDEQIIKQIEEIANIVQMEGCSDYLTSLCCDQERWINFCGVTACFVNQQIALIRAADMEVSIAPICLANDNESSRLVSEKNACLKMAVQFHDGGVKNLHYWHKELTSFMPSTYTSL